ncbi:hypothetical protein CLOP_g14214, partial [Closterium sp. NIES-67]
SNFLFNKENIFSLLT